MSLDSVRAEPSISSPIMAAAGDYADTMDWSLAYMTNTVGLTSHRKLPLLSRGGYDNELGRTLTFHRRRREELRHQSFGKGSVDEGDLAKKRKRLVPEGEDDDDVLATEALRASLNLECPGPKATVENVGRMDITIGQQLLELSKAAAVSLFFLPFVPAIIASSAVSNFFEAARTKFWAKPTRDEAPAIAAVDSRGDQRQTKRKKRRHTKKRSQTLDLVSNPNTLPHTEPASGVLHTPRQVHPASPIATHDDPFISAPFESRADGGGGGVAIGKASRVDIQAMVLKHAVEDGTTGKPLEEVMKESVGRTEMSFSQEENVINQMRELEISPGSSWISVQKYSRRFEAREKKKREHLKKLKEEQERKDRERLEAEAKERALAKARSFERPTPPEAVIKPLSSEWEAKVDALMRSDPGVPLARTSTGVELKLNSFRTLLPRPGELGWLDDEIINAYMQAVVDYGNGDGGVGAKRLEPPRYHAFNSFFYKKLNESGPATLARWSKRAKIEGNKLLQVELIFIPVHLGNHWTLLVVSGTKKSIEYFDSMNGSAARPLKNAKLWLQHELKDKWVEDEWKIPGTLGPCQRNGYDCGVFTVTTAKMLMLGINPLAYSQSDICLQRRRMAAELHYGGFRDEFSPLGPPGGGGSWGNR